jgi:hypothetical protein
MERRGCLRGRRSASRPARRDGQLHALAGRSLAPVAVHQWRARRDHQSPVLEREPVEPSVTVGMLLRAIALLRQPPDMALDLRANPAGPAPIDRLRLDEVGLQHRDNFLCVRGGRGSSPSLIAQHYVAVAAPPSRSTPTYDATSLHIGLI